MAKPPMSEIFEAMATGVTEPYIGNYSQNSPGAMQLGSFDSQSFDRAREQAAMFRAIAAVYRKYEAQEAEEAKAPAP